jgi:hypothetical protein
LAGSPFGGVANWLAADRTCLVWQVGEPGYSLQIGLPRLADALDSVMEDSDRYSLVVDLGGMATTFFQYRDCNLLNYCKPSDIEPERIRKGYKWSVKYSTSNNWRME